MATPSSRNKHTLLCLQHRHGLGSWFLHGCDIDFATSTRPKAEGDVYHHSPFVSFHIFAGYLRKLLDNPWSSACKNTRNWDPLPKLQGTKLTAFKDTLYSSCCVTCGLAASFCSVQHNSVLSSMLSTEFGVVCKCSALGQFYGKSFSLQL